MFKLAVAAVVEQFGSDVWRVCTLQRDRDLVRPQFAARSGLSVRSRVFTRSNLVVDVCGFDFVRTGVVIRILVHNRQRIKIDDAGGE